MNYSVRDISITNQGPLTNAQVVNIERICRRRTGINFGKLEDAIQRAPRFQES